MTAEQNHPITPPPELVTMWVLALEGHTDTEVFTQAARWGADQELEACCEWIEGEIGAIDPNDLRATRRPKPLSLKQQALKALPADIPGLSMRVTLHPDDVALVRRALEALPD